MWKEELYSTDERDQVRTFGSRKGKLLFYLSTVNGYVKTFLEKK